MEKLTKESFFEIIFPKKGNKTKHKEYGVWSRSEYEVKDTKEYFSLEGNSFDFKQVDLKKYHSMIGEGFAFFPINEGTKWSDVERYEKMGFKIAFMRAGIFKQMQRLYKDWV